MKINFVLKAAQGWGVKKPTTKTPTKTNRPTRIIIYLHWETIRLKVSTGRTITPDKWDFKDQDGKDDVILHEFLYGNKERPGLKAMIQAGYNDYLASHKNATPSIEEMKTIVDQAINPTKYTATAPTDLIAFFERYIEELPTRYNDKKKSFVSPFTVKRQRSTLATLKDFRKTLLVHTINADFFTDFSKFLRVEKNFAVNTQGTHIKILKTVIRQYNDTFQPERPIHIPKTFKTITEETNAIYLDVATLHEFAALELNERLNKVRDLFLIGCWSGLRFRDLSTLRPEHIGTDGITIKTHKTGQTVVIPIFPELRTILNKYVIDGVQTLPRPLSNQKMNDYIKEIAAKIPTLHEKTTRDQKKKEMHINTCELWELVTMHTARRTFATNMYLNDMPAALIMKITGHQTERQFFDYIRTTPDDSAKRLLELWKNRNRRAI
jgi:integrase